MKIMEKVKNIGGEKRKTFPAAVKELAEKDKDAKFVIYEKSGMKGKYLDEVAILDALEIAGDIERALSEEHGGGEYQISLFKSDSELVEKFNYSIAGQPKGRRTSGNKEAQKERTSGSEERYYRVLDKLADAAMGGRTSSADEFQRVLVLAKELRGDGGMEKEMLVVLLNNLVESKGNDLDTALGILEISQRLQPKVEREDALTSLANTVMPIIGQVIAAKRGLPAAGVDSNLMNQITEAVAQYQASAAASPGMGLPPPGASDAGAAAPGTLAGAPATVQEQPAEAPTPPVAGSQEYFMLRFVEPFRRDVAAGQSDEELAYQIVSMTQYARDRMADNLPPLVADFVTATNLAAHGVALAKFFAAIPELANLTQKCESIKNCLIRMFTTGPDEAAPVEEAAIVQDDDTTIIEQTDAPQGATDQEQRIVAEAEESGV